MCFSDTQTFSPSDKSNNKITELLKSFQQTHSVQISINCRNDPVHVMNVQRTLALSVILSMQCGLKEGVASCTCEARSSSGRQRPAWGWALTFLKPVCQMRAHVGAHGLVLPEGGVLAKRGQH